MPEMNMIESLNSALDNMLEAHDNVVIFGEDGELYNAKFQHEGASAKLLFFRIRLDLENIMNGEEE